MPFWSRKKELPSMADAITTPSGLRYIDEVIGEGDPPERGK